MADARSWLSVGEGVWRAEGATLPQGLDTLVWDVDGVLVDTSRSYPKVVTQAVTILLDMAGAPGRGSTVAVGDIRHFKALSGFNSDWALAFGLTAVSLALLPRVGGSRSAVRRALTARGFLEQAARAGGGVDGLLAPVAYIAPAAVRAALRRTQQLPVYAVCETLYGGEETEELFGHPPILHHPGPGLWRREAPRLTRADLDLLPGVRHAIYTGRVRGELLPALRVTGLEPLIPPSLRITPEDGLAKPDPEGLRRIAALLGTRAGLYVGDNVDDAHTVAALRRGGDHRFAFAGVLGGVLGGGARRTFAQAGADLLAAGPRPLVTWLAGRRA